MSLSAKLIITLTNPDYAGPGGTGTAEFSTIKVEKTLSYDPLLKHHAKIPIKLNLPSGVTTLTCEVRNKSWDIDATGAGIITVATYSVTPLGVPQPDGSVYGN